MSTQIKILFSSITALEKKNLEINYRKCEIGLNCVSEKEIVCHETAMFHFLSALVTVS